MVEAPNGIKELKGAIVELHQTIAALREQRLWQLPLPEQSTVLSESHALTEATPPYSPCTVMGASGPGPLLHFGPGAASIIMGLAR